MFSAYKLATILPSTPVLFSLVKTSNYQRGQRMSDETPLKYVQSREEFPRERKRPRGEPASILASVSWRTITNGRVSPDCPGTDRANGKVGRRGSPVPKDSKRTTRERRGLSSDTSHPSVPLGFPGASVSVITVARSVGRLVGRATEGS